MPLLIHVEPVYEAYNDFRNAYPAKYVAVKVLTVNATAGVVQGFLREVDSLKTIKTANPDHPGHQHCLRLYDVITERSRHGPHICIVTNILGMNMIGLRRLQPNGHAFPVAVTKRIVKQTFFALDYLHRECGFVHSGVYFSFVLYQKARNRQRDL